MNTNKLTITIPLNDFIDAVLGTTLDKRPISDTVAEIIKEKTKNNPEFGFVVQFPSEFFPGLRSPVLWRSVDWECEYEKRKADKERSQKLREESYIFAANMKIVMKAFMEFSGCDEPQARTASEKLLRKKMYKHIETFCDKKLITKVEEIP